MWEWVLILTHVIFMTCGNVGIWGVFTADSLLSAADFLLSVVTGMDVESVSSVETEKRYIYYGVLILAYYYTGIVTNWAVSPRVFMVMASPTAVYAVTQNAHWYHVLYIKYKKKRDRLLRTIACNITAHACNTMCRDALDCEAYISGKEVDAVFSAYEYRYLYNLVRVVVVVNIVATIDQTSRKLGDVVRALYTRGKILDINSPRHGYVDPHPDTADSKTKIKRIVLSRRWDLFYNPKILEMLIDLYENGEKGGVEKWTREMLKWLQTVTAQFFAVWTLTSMMPHWMSVAVVTTVIFVCRRPRNTELASLLMFKVMGVAIYAYTGNEIYAAAVSEITDLLWNRGVHWVCRKLAEKTTRGLTILTHDNRFNRYLVFYPVIACVLYRVLGAYSICVVLLTPYLVHNWIAYWTLLGALSGFGAVHMVWLTAVLYLTVNVVNHKTTPRPSIECDMIQSYYIQQTAPAPDLDGFTHLLAAHAVATPPDPRIDTERPVKRVTIIDNYAQ